MRSDFKDSLCLLIGIPTICTIFYLAIGNFINAPSFSNYFIEFESFARWFPPFCLLFGQACFYAGRHWED